ncbi:MAG: DUF4377 domain-containing protein [Marinirhabdus sp.]|nr:DUF4377 domain-containing protein [Marinirhabdus sp.]
MKILVILCSLIAINSCNNSAKNDSTITTYMVNSTKVPCEGVGKQQCLQIKPADTPDANWSNFYGNIDGFSFQPGYMYRIKVEETELDAATVPADASTIQYTLVEIMSKEQDPTTRLHDIWSLQTLNGNPMDSDRYAAPRTTPRLEIFVADKRIGGTDGCNSMFGTIETLTETEIQFSKLGGTRIMCPNMEVPNLFMEAMGKTKTYSLKGLQLYFYDDEGNEVLEFLKVD